MKLLSLYYFDGQWTSASGFSPLLGLPVPEVLASSINIA
jgi:hypothetical protein